MSLRARRLRAFHGPVARSRLRRLYLTLGVGSMWSGPGALLRASAQRTTNPPEVRVVSEPSLGAPLCGSVSHLAEMTTGAFLALAAVSGL
jgi:hypothetical protein